MKMDMVMMGDETGDIIMWYIMISMSLTWNEEFKSGQMFIKRGEE
jgi:hypothetical protein